MNRRDPGEAAARATCTPSAPSALPTSSHMLKTQVDSVVESTSGSLKTPRLAAATGQRAQCRDPTQLPPPEHKSQQYSAPASNSQPSPWTISPRPKLGTETSNGMVRSAPSRPVAAFMRLLRVRLQPSCGSFASGCSLHEYGACPFAICCAGGAADLSELWHMSYGMSYGMSYAMSYGMRPVMAETSFRWVQGHWLQGR